MGQYGYVLSLNARGIPTFTWTGINSCGSGMNRTWKNFLDIGLSWVVFLRLLNSTSWLSLTLVFFSTLFYYMVLKNVKSLDNVWTIYCFLIVLPILILVVMVYNRREAALKQVVKVKTIILALFHLHRDFGSSHRKNEESGLQQLRQLLHSFLDHMQAYFNHARPTATHFHWPYGPSDPLPGSVLGNEALTIHALHGTVLLDIKKLTQASQFLRLAGAGDAVVLQHHVLVSQLHRAFQRMALVKEMRTPLVLRTCCLFYSTVILPLLLGPFWSLMGRNMGLVFAVFVALLTHSVMLGLLNLTVMYEDPFDDKVMSQSVDNVSIVELADTCKWLMEDDDAEHALLHETTRGLPPGPLGLPPGLSLNQLRPPLAQSGHALFTPAGEPTQSTAIAQRIPMSPAPHSLSISGTAPGGFPQLQFTGTGNRVMMSVKRTALQVKSPASVSSPPMPPIIGSEQIPEGARMDFDA